jgi:N,N'-diacetyllegionaminate synthase
MGMITEEWTINHQVRPVYIIAEAGINHNGSMEEAKRLIAMAKYSGADAVKFQTYSADAICRKDNAEYDMLKSCELTHDQFRELQRDCRSVGIDFISTPHDVPSAIFLESLGMPYMKIGSGQSTAEFIDQIPGTTPLIVSLGMGKWPFQFHPRIHCQMHCVSSYPA